MERYQKTHAVFTTISLLQQSLTPVLVGILFLSSAILLAQENVLELKNLGREQIQYTGFILKTNKKVHIKAIGAGGDKEIKRITNFQEDQFNLFAYAWILDAKSREMVWRMTIDNTKKVGWSDLEREFDGDVSLKAGEYEVYYSTVEPLFLDFEGGFITFNKLMKKIFSGESDWEEFAHKWTFRIEDVDEVINSREVKKGHLLFRESCLYQMTGVENAYYESVGFTLTEPLEVSIYAVGEGYKGKMFDYGWIIDARTRQEVWIMKESETEHAGGANKNRILRQTLKLDKGDYLVYFKTDDNHSSEEWNANPPYDPFFWGICIKAKDNKFDRTIIKKFKEEDQKAIVEITRIGDFAYKEEGLELAKDCKLRIYALGEGRDGEMFDYGWITDVNSGRIVWKMKFDKTKHAGGASKNRLFDDVIHLPAGKYIVHYQSDDSHSYEEWNMRPPQEPEKWGIAIYPIDQSCGATSFDRTELKSENVLAQLVRIGDDEHMRKQFHLKQSTRVRIYCLGEGDWDEMYDYGWIKNDETKETVWKMNFPDTEHAGGAQKNRIVDVTITLPAGDYTVHYRTDDSHSYPDWNARAPHDERNWGITIYKVE